MDAFIVISFLVGGLPQASLPSQLLPEQVVVQKSRLKVTGWKLEKTPPAVETRNFASLLLPPSRAPHAKYPALTRLSAKPYASPAVPPQLVPPGLEEIIENSCNNVPSGVGIPGFQPGIHKSDVIRMLGVPSISSAGYWPNTRAVSYELIPDQVSLGFLFDKHSERIRQTEAAFTAAVDSQIILLTLNGMLGCKLNDPIKQGLEKVRQGQSRRYNFNLGQLKGVIERDKRDRIYIGIWEGDLH